MCVGNNMHSDVFPNDARCDALAVQIPIQRVMTEVSMVLGIVRQGEVDLTRQQELTVVHAGWIHVAT